MSDRMFGAMAMLAFLMVAFVIAVVMMATNKAEDEAKAKAQQISGSYEVTRTEVTDHAFVRPSECFLELRNDDRHLGQVWSDGFANFDICVSLETGDNVRLVFNDSGDGFRFWNYLEVQSA